MDVVNSQAANADADGNEGDHDDHLAVLQLLGLTDEANPDQLTSFLARDADAADLGEFSIAC